MDAWSAAVQDLAERASDRAAETEAAGRVPDDLAARAIELGLFKMTMPTAWNGRGLTPGRAYEVGRELARADGSLGWLATVSTAWFGIMAATADNAHVREVLADERAMMAGGVAGFGTATPEGAGYEVEGRWDFCSGAWFGTWLGGLCVDTSAQPPATFIVFVPADRAIVEATWDVAGLRGTGSDTVVLPRQHVPAAWATRIPYPPDDPSMSNEPIALASRGFWPTAWAAAATQLGIARRALDEVVAFARAKTRPLANAPLITEQAFVRDLMRAEAAWRSADLGMVHTVDGIWERACAGRSPDRELRVAARLACTHASQIGATVVRTCFDLAGASAIGREHPLARCHRDGTILCHHASVAPSTYETLGRVALGFEPDSGII